VTTLCARIDTFLDHLGDGDYISLDCRATNCSARDVCSHACHTRPVTTAGTSAPATATHAPGETGPLAGGTHSLNLELISRLRDEAEDHDRDTPYWYIWAPVWASQKSVTPLLDAIHAALALHPQTTIYTSGSTEPGFYRPDSRVICGLCRDTWPCKTVEALS
jgi:hypothetical protein